MTDYIFALLFGAGIVVFFAWDQFNRPSYEGSRELTRLVELLKPARMRKRTVYWRAYAFYATILLLIYFTLCAYGLLLGPTLGLQIPGYGDAESAGQVVGATEIPSAPGVPAEGSGYDPEAIRALPQTLSQPLTAETPAGEARDPEDAFRSDPTVPLFISLIMVGLAPSVPILVRIEERIRFASHRLSGIPTRLISGSRQLRLRSLRLAAGPDALLISPQDWRRLEHYAELGRRHLDDPKAFLEDIAKIIAFRSWFLEEKLPIANHATRDSVAEVEAGIRKGVDRLIFTLDTLSGFEGVSAAPLPEGVGDQARLAWEAVAKEADQVCADVCILTMLYVEHGVLPTEDDADRLGWGVEPEAGDGDVARQIRLAERMIMRHVSDAARYVERENLSMVLWARATAVALILSLFYGLLFGRDSAAAGSASLVAGSRLLLGLLFLTSGALTYALALLVAISWRQSAFQSGSWRNVFRHHWSRWIPQFVTVFLLSGLAALICVVGNNIYATIGAVGVETVLANWPRVLLFAVLYNGPVALLGAVLAMVVILIVDAWRSGDPGALWLGRLPWLSCAAMFLTGLGTRLMMTQAAAASDRPFDLLCRGAGEAAASFEPAFEGETLANACLQAIWLPAVSAGTLAGLIGLAVALFVRGTLEHEFPQVKDDAPRPQQPVAPAPGGGVG